VYLDEATSSLDSPTEARLMETICHVSSGKTVIMVAEEIADTYGRRDLLRFVSRPKNSPDFLVGIGVP
jgi:ABC-type transport system involved in cytochrome bd biosynthesis fused ATPase/permease subunit